MAQRFDAESTIAEDSWAPSWNVALTDRVPVLISDGRGRRLGFMRWGWPKEWNLKSLHPNAVAKSAATKVTFSESFARRRCMIPATSFYEWKSIDKKTKLPYSFQMRGGGLFGLAGLWKTFEIGGQREARFLLLTAPPNELIAPVADTMAAVLSQGSEALWLDGNAEVMALTKLLVSYNAALMAGWRVSTKVNSVKATNGPDLIKPIE